MKIHNFVMWVLLLNVGVQPSVNAADDTLGFTARPGRCIALNQGQLCYQNIEFSWSTPAEGRFCLREQDSDDDIICWAGNQRSGYILEFVSDRNVVYLIRDEMNSDIISEVEVEVVWVYKSNRNSFSRWRLF